MSTLQVEVRPLRAEDLDGVMALEERAFASIPPERRWRREQVEAHLGVFPGGQFAAEAEGRLLGTCMNLRTTWERATRPHTWHELTGRGSLSTHLPHGDTLYGTEIMVDPAAQGRGVGLRLFQERFAYVRARGLRGFATGGRLPGYPRHAEAMTPHEYAERVARGELRDPVLSFDLKVGCMYRGVLCGYLHDPGSLHHAALVVWENPAWKGRGARGLPPAAGNG